MDLISFQVWLKKTQTQTLKHTPTSEIALVTRNVEPSPSCWENAGEGLPAVVGEQ